MERHEIETFLTLAEELHFGRATERLGLSQGRVSQTIKKLERRFGALLFERTSRRVALTPVGERLRDDLLPAQRQIRHAINRATAAGRGITASLRVGYSAYWCGDLVVRADEVFRQRHPDCAVHVQEVSLGDPLGPLRAGELDLQLTELPIDEPDITNGPILFTEPRALIVPAGHPLARRETLSLEDLTDIPLVDLTGDIPRYWLDWNYPAATPSGRPIPRGPAASTWPDVHLLVAMGKAATPAARKAAQYHFRPDVVVVPFSDAPPLEYALLWPTAKETALVREFTDIAVALAARR
ncbi:LysR family transcriptional regulator [Nonomuraea sp. NPDC050404]|uniref:LysR substrate-binding domain-containing protein n=1 Tax=Nonomuraea sp. NPDC050404 TaxID=3155783 RepID=UPI0033F30B6A